MSAFNECPKCNGDLEGQGFEADGDYVWQRVICEECGFEWNEVFKHTHNETTDGKHHLDNNGNPIVPVPSEPKPDPKPKPEQPIIQIVEKDHSNEIMIIVGVIIMIFGCIMCSIFPIL